MQFTTKLLPSTYYLSNTTYLKISDAEYMYTDTDSTTCATVTNSRAATTAYYAYIRGFDFNSIPSSATNITFSIKVKVRESGGQTTSGNTYVGLYNGTTAINGTPSSGMSTTANVITFSTTLSWATLKGYGSNFGIRLNAARKNRNTTAYLYIYGAEIDVTYEIPTVDITVNQTNKGNGSGEVTPLGTDAYAIDTKLTIKCTPDDPEAKVSLKKDGTSITTQWEVIDSGSLKTPFASYIVDSGTLSGAAGVSSAVGIDYDGTAASTTNAYCSTNNSTAKFHYTFDASDIPENATITSAKVMIKGKLESTTNTQEKLECTIYSNGEAITEAKQFPSTTASVIEFDLGQPTREQLVSLEVHVEIGYYGGNIQGASLLVEYSLPPTYIYTSPTLTTSDSATYEVIIATNTLYYKVDGVWKRVLKSYIKNDDWAESKASDTFNDYELFVKAVQ